MRTIHICQSVSGALKNWKKSTWEAVARDNCISAARVKEQFRIYEFEGKEVIPLGEPCEGFSYQTGCPGHEVKDEYDLCEDCSGGYVCDAHLKMRE